MCDEHVTLGARGDFETVACAQEVGPPRVTGFHHDEQVGVEFPCPAWNVRDRRTVGQQCAESAREPMPVEQRGRSVGGLALRTEAIFCDDVLSDACPLQLAADRRSRARRRGLT